MIYDGRKDSLIRFFTGESIKRFDIIIIGLKIFTTSLYKNADDTSYYAILSSVQSIRNGSA